MAYGIQVVADSISQQGQRLTTMVVTFPRIVLSEFNTHRVFSRNSASTRAIPIKKQIERLREDPFIPEYWGRNQPGMQAEEQIPVDFQLRAHDLWRLAVNRQIDMVMKLVDMGTDSRGETVSLHKQVAGRLLEPFMWHTVVVTATEWQNFFALRANPQAQPEIRTAAEMMQEALKDHQPTELGPMDWHLPFVQPDERDGHFERSELARKVSAARSARVSYLTHDGRRSLSDDLKLYDRLVSGGHMSPLEHVATPADGWHGNFNGWKQLRKFIPGEADFSKMSQLNESADEAAAS